MVVVDFHNFPSYFHKISPGTEQTHDELAFRFSSKSEAPSVGATSGNALSPREPERKSPLESCDIGDKHREELSLSHRPWRVV